MNAALVILAACAMPAVPLPRRTTETVYVRLPPCCFSEAPIPPRERVRVRPVDSQPRDDSWKWLPLSRNVVITFRGNVVGREALPRIYAVYPAEVMESRPSRVVLVDGEVREIHLLPPAEK